MTFRPKRFAPPRSRKHRVLVDERRFGSVTFVKILKEHYPQAALGGGREFRRPRWAREALRRGWMTLPAYFAVPEEFTGRVMEGVLHVRSPLLGLIRKGAS